MTPLEKMEDLTLKLWILIRDGKGDDPEANRIREEMDFADPEYETTGITNELSGDLSDLYNHEISANTEEELRDALVKFSKWCEERGTFYLGHGMLKAAATFFDLGDTEKADESLHDPSVN